MPRNANLRTMLTAGAPGVDSLPTGRWGSIIQAGEIFRIAGGKALDAFLPRGTKSGWVE